MRNLIGWITAHPLHAGAGALALLAAAFFLHVVTMQPRNDRRWKEYLSHTTQVTLTDTGFAITPVSDWSYSPKEPTDKSYGDFQANFADLQNVWFMLEPSPGSDWVAHTLLLFEFTGGRIVGLTIEARLEEKETYSPFDGLWNRYELAYMWASAHDLLTRRAVMLGHRVYVYPLKLTAAQRVGLLRNLLVTTSQLQTVPRFYNTIFSNCTNELGKRAGLPWDYAFVLTGKSAGLLFRKGIIPGPSFAVTKKRADLTAWLKAQNAAPKAGFDAALLSELRRRAVP